MFGSMKDTMKVGKASQDFFFAVQKGGSAQQIQAGARRLAPVAAEAASKARDRSAGSMIAGNDALYASEAANFERIASAAQRVATSQPGTSAFDSAVQACMNALAG